jgi:protein-tyrosine phosphatase
MAEAAMRRALREEGDRIEVLSAGVMAANGAPASRLAAEVAESAGMSLEGHRSAGLDNRIIEQADLVLVLGEHELEVIRQRVPAAAERTWLITDFGRERATGEGIPDPFGGSREAYEECLHRIEEQVARIAPIITREVRVREPADSDSRERRNR